MGSGGERRKRGCPPNILEHRLLAHSFVTGPAAINMNWHADVALDGSQVHEAIKKHYNFED